MANKTKEEPRVLTTEDYIKYIKDPQKFHETYTKEEMLNYVLEKKKSAKKHRLSFIVEEVRGVCPMYKEGDVALVIDSDNVNEEINYSLTKRTCMHFMDNIQYRLTWSRAPKETYDHLTITSGEVRTCCTHPGPPYTACGGVIFVVKREELE